MKIQHKKSERHEEICQILQSFVNTGNYILQQLLENKKKLKSKLQINSKHSSKLQVYQNQLKELAEYTNTNLLNIHKYYKCKIVQYNVVDYSENFKRVGSK